MKNINKNSLLANRYELVELVGEGAMGRVYRAKDTLLGNVIVAVKFLAQTMLSQKMRDRFKQEIDISAHLGTMSNHIIRVRDCGVDENDVPFYVMEFLEGENLDEIIKYEGLPLDRFLNLTRQICLGLKCAHQGINWNGEKTQIIHRDIKPSNILVLPDPTLGEWAKILDFGIAKLNQTSEDQTYSFMGTLAYCSPEQMEGKELDNRSDIYSLGIMMYEMLTCDLPFIPESSSFGGWYIAHHETEPKPFSPDLNVPKDLEKLIFKCLAKKRKNRPKDVNEILQGLEKIKLDSKEKNRSTVTKAEAKAKKTPAPTVVKPSKPAPTPAPTPASNKNFIYVAKEEDRQKIPNLKNKCTKITWPAKKIEAGLVCPPRILETEKGEIPALFVMLDFIDLINRKSSSVFNTFLYVKQPYPMVLWLSVLYNDRHGPRFLPRYLDLKKPRDRKAIQVLSVRGFYQILLFGVNDPEHCQKCFTATIAPEQCQNFKQWVYDSQIIKVDPKQASFLANKSKELFKAEYPKLKNQITLKLQAASNNLANN